MSDQRKVTPANLYLTNVGKITTANNHVEVELSRDGFGQNAKQLVSALVDISGGLPEGVTSSDVLALFIAEDGGTIAKTMQAVKALKKI